MSGSTPPPRRRRIAGERIRATVGTPAPAVPAGRDGGAGSGDETPPARDTGAPPAREAGAPRWLVPIIALTIVATVLAGWMGWQTLNDEAEADTGTAAVGLPGSEAVGDATRAATVLLSYRYDRLDSQLEAMSDLMTEDYSKQYLATFPENVRQRLVDDRIVVDTTVRAAAPMECGTACEPDEAQVLLFIDKVTTSAGGEEERVPNRVVLSMQRKGDTWLVDDVISY